MKKSVGLLPTEKDRLPKLGAWQSEGLDVSVVSNTLLKQEQLINVYVECKVGNGCMDGSHGPTGMDLLLGSDNWVPFKKICINVNFLSTFIKI